VPLPFKEALPSILISCECFFMKKSSSQVTYFFNMFFHLERYLVISLVIQLVLVILLSGAYGEGRGGREMEGKGRDKSPLI
jgi:hypothetical protein